MKAKSVLMIGSCLLALIACDEQGTAPSVSEESFSLGADQVMNYMQTRITSNGVLTTLIDADTAYFFEEARRVDMIGVSVAFNTEQGAEVGKLTSETGDYNTVDGMFIARGNVVLITQGTNGERKLETEELHYDTGGGEIWTDSPFTLTEDGQVRRGTTFRTDSEFRTWEVTGIQADGSVPGEGGISF